jgi:DUF971 family protein
MSSDPQHIAVSKSKGIRIDWKDSHQSEYPLRYLRDHCPCATCANTHGAAPVKPQDASPFPLYKPALKIDSIEPVGNYALLIKWNDGHRTGIYSFEYFRRICPCPNCSGEPLPASR